jgi:predicted  nucleic acid-binding Zn-ribbon protein
MTRTGWREVYRCTECGKIYQDEIPYICKKCGTEIGETTPYIFQVMGFREVLPTDRCEMTVAKRTLFGWKVRKSKEEKDGKIV